MKCEICGAEASVHVTDVYVTEAHSDNTRGERQLCLTCAQQVGLPVSTDFTHYAQKIRKLAAFIKTNNRMPSTEELRLFGGAGTMPLSEPGTSDFQEQLNYLESQANFLEQHKRFPTEEELPDPF
jgi:hypothetical protein